MKSTERPRLSVSERFYRRLMRAYARDTRRRSGSDMIETFRDAHWRARQSGWLALGRLWVVTIFDLVVSAIPDRIGRHKHRRTSNHRKGSSVENFWHDLRFGMRGLRRSPAFTSVVLITLGLGIGANTAIFSLINEVLLRPLPIHDPGNVVRVYTSDFSSGRFGTSSFPDFRDFAEQPGALDGLAASSFTMAATLRTDEAGDRVTTTLVSGEYFSVLGLQPAVGRFIGAADDRTVGAHPVAVISWGTWQRRLGGRPDAIGETITLNGTPFTLIGVAPERFSGLEIGNGIDVWVPLTMYQAIIPFLAGRPILQMRSGRWLNLVGRLAADVPIERAEAELNGVMARLAEEYPQSNLGTLHAPDDPRPITVLAVQDAALGGGARDSAETRAILLMSVVGVVLLIACANVANLLVARSARRRREIAVRLAIGAGRGRVIQQMLTESTMLGLLGGVAGIIFAVAAGGLLVPLGLPNTIQGSLDSVTPSIDGRVLAYAIGLSALTGLLFGSLPAWQASRAVLVPALKDGDASGAAPGQRYGLRDGLVVVQIAGSLVLLFSAGLFVRSTLAAYQTELGFTVEDVLLASLDVSQEGMTVEQGHTFYRELLDRTRDLPGVQAAALATVVPVHPSGSRMTFQPEGYEALPDEDLELNFNVVSDGFFETLQISLLAGRRFRATDSDNAPGVAIVNRTFVERFWPDGIALGRRIDNDGQPITVVGVVNDTKYRAVREDPMPYVYRPLAQSFEGRVSLALRSSIGPDIQLSSVRSLVHELAGPLPLYDVRTLRDQLDDALSQTRSTTAMIGSLGALALLLAAVGIYGVMAYAVVQRRQELGIRTALGASRFAVIGLVLTRGFWLAVVGVTLGVVIALALSRVIGGFVADVSPTDPLTVVGVVLLMGTVAMTASVLPAVRASRTDPVIALRSE